MSTQTQRTIGSSIREVRRSVRLSQKDVAMRVSEISGHPLSEKAIDHYETGRRSPRVEVLERIAHVLGVTTSYIVSMAEAGRDKIADTSRLTEEQRKTVMDTIALFEKHGGTQ